MGVLNENFTLVNQVEIPKIGFGTWQIPNGDVCFKAVASAVKAGYRHIDTARAYGNEASVGQAVRASGIARDQFFITTKLPAEVKSYDGALASFEKTMKALDMAYVDLYLIHAPWPWNEAGADYSRQNAEVWKAMEEIYRSGRARSIGVSNFNVSDLQYVFDRCQIKPMVNQIRFFIGYTEEDVTAFCQVNDVLVEGYSPLATGAILDNQEIAAMAEKYNTSVAQICLRYVLQRDVLPLPKSTHDAYIKANTEIDFVISESDMANLNKLSIDL